MFENLRIVAELAGTEEETNQLVESLEERVAAVETALEGVEETPLVFYELDATDPNAPYTAGAGTFIDTLLSMAKGENLGSRLEGSYVQISLEELVVQSPDVILLGDSVWGGVTPEVVAQRAGWEQLEAVQNNTVYPFDDNLVSRPGPRLVDGVEQLARLLHPEAFQ
jgi:iron complex transport system substrate-binding protein